MTCDRCKGPTCQSGSVNCFTIPGITGQFCHKCADEFSKIVKAFLASENQYRLSVRLLNIKLRSLSYSNRQATRDVNTLLTEVERLEARFTAPIVCICGSTKFKQAWISENARLTGEGNIALAVGLWGHHERIYPDAATKEKLDNLHKRKIDLCDWVWVLDVGGYIGDSTKSEIEYAAKLGKAVRYLSVEFPEYTEPKDDLLEKVERLQAQRATLRAALRHATEDGEFHYGVKRELMTTLKETADE